MLAAGRGDIGTLFVSMARRHPEGTDAEYLRWHTLDHRPEQHRLSAVRASLRLVSTPECRAARAAGDERFDAIDHVMTYFFTDEAGCNGFNELSAALGDAGRKLRPAAAGTARRLRRARQGGGTAREGRRRRAAVVAGRAASTCCSNPTTAPHGASPTSTAWPGCGRRPVADGRREPGECPAGPADHLLLPRRRSRSTSPSDCGRC